MLEHQKVTHKGWDKNLLHLGLFQHPQDRFMHICESKKSILFSDKICLFLAVIKSDTLGSAPHMVRSVLIYAPSSAEREQLTTNTQQNLLL